MLLHEIFVEIPNILTKSALRTQTKSLVVFMFVKYTVRALSDTGTNETPLQTGRLPSGIELQQPDSH